MLFSCEGRNGLSADQQAARKAMPSSFRMSATAGFPARVAI
jgi:hypothetical protein